MRIRREIRFAKIATEDFTQVNAVAEDLEVSFRLGMPWFLQIMARARDWVVEHSPWGLTLARKDEIYYIEMSVNEGAAELDLIIRWVERYMNPPTPIVHQKAIPLPPQRRQVQEVQIAA